jgi:hypothetical protein
LNYRLFGVSVPRRLGTVTCEVIAAQAERS